MLHKETVSEKLFQIAVKQEFRMVGGTAIALQLGHRKSIDIDFFSNEKINKREVVEALKKVFPGHQIYFTQDHIQLTVDEVKVDLYDDWYTPLLDASVELDGLRMASLKDLAALKFDTIISRREKKDYIDLHFLFTHLGALNVVKEFKTYNPHLSDRSVLFALGEVAAARENKSTMPEMLVNISWNTIEQSVINAARLYLSMKKGNAHGES